MSIHTRRFLLAMGAYVLLTVVAVLFIQTDQPLWLRTVVGLLPVVPGLFIVLAVVGAIRAQDELIQRMHLEALAFAFAALFLLTLTETFLAPLGYPPDRAGTRLLIMAALWLVGLLLARRRYR